MAAYEDLVLPDNGFETRGSRQLLWDIWYAIRSKTGLGKLLDAIADRVWARQIDRYDGNGKVNGKTSVALESQWAAANFARVNGNIAGLSELVKQLAVKQGAVIDIDAIAAASAKAVADELSKRIAS